MKELIEKLELLKDKLINSEDLEFVGQFEVVHEAIQSLTQEPSAVSAEEVLNKFVGIYVDDNVDKVYLKSDVLKAMQEYAKTSKREHAIDEEQIIEEILQEEITKDAFADFTIDSIKQAMMKYGKYLQQYNIR